MRTTQNGDFVLLLFGVSRPVGAVAPERVVASFLCSLLVSCTCALLLNIHRGSRDRTQAVPFKTSHIHCTIFNRVMSPTFVCVDVGC